MNIIMKKGRAIHYTRTYTDKHKKTYLIRECGGQFLYDSPKIRLTAENVTCKKCLERLKNVIR